ncbi:hypothetical protein OBBRIDRAFT_342603 [Obba rivulosa]|uniref:Uncharacterized protein n=1 Tax=Obba rivulosa TaxID=1052685 RepID=A0A8E2DFL6_9APHY|nr:hypothetical protein OBBRIDRAFT_342603 [Obba rivulosa]
MTYRDLIASRFVDPFVPHLYKRLFVCRGHRLIPQAWSLDVYSARLQDLKYFALRLAFSVTTMPLGTPRQPYQWNHPQPYARPRGYRTTRPANQPFPESRPPPFGHPSGPSHPTRAFPDAHQPKDPPFGFVPVRPCPQRPADDPRANATPFAETADRARPAEPAHDVPPPTRPSADSRFPRDRRPATGPERFRAQAAANRRALREFHRVVRLATPDPDALSPSGGPISDEDRAVCERLEKLRLDGIFQKQLAEERAIVERVALKRDQRVKQMQERDAAVEALVAECQREQERREAEARAEQADKRQREEYRLAEEKRRAEYEAEQAACLAEIEELQRRRMQEAQRKAEEMRKEQERRRAEELRREEVRKRMEEILREQARRAEETRRQFEEYERQRQEHERQAREEEARRARLREEEIRLVQEAARRAAEDSQASAIEQTLTVYDGKWDTLLHPPSNLGPIPFHTVPWPTFHTVTGPDDITHDRVSEFIFHPLRRSMQHKTRRDRLKIELVRWHPDKFNGRTLPRIFVPDQARVGEVAQAVAKCLTHIKSEVGTR